MPAQKKKTAQFRAQFLAAVDQHSNVTDLCKKFKISRKTFYKWKNIFEKENHTQSRKQGRKTTIDVRILEMVKQLIVANPQWSVDKLYNEICLANNGMQLVSRHWIQYQLQKNKLSTHQNRRIYSYAISPPALNFEPVTIPQALAPIPLGDQQVLQAGNSSPPRINKYKQIIYSKINQTYSTLHPFVSPHIPSQYKNHIKSIALFVWINPYKSLFTSLIALANAYLFGLVGNAVIQAEGIGGKIGTVFSAIALFCGTFFFLYSLKYYFTVAMVILRSRTTKATNPIGSESNLKEKLLHSLKIAGAYIGRQIESPHTNPVELQKEVVREELAEFPFFSVQIPLYNEKKVANRVVAAAVAMDYPNFEVIVCDDSTDETTQLLQEKWADHPKVRILHRKERTGYKGAALHNALSYMNAKTDYVVVFDADFVPYPDTLNLFAKYFAVIGRNELNNSSIQRNYSANNILTSQNSAGDYYNRTVALQGYQWHVLNKSENWITRAVRTEFSGSYIIERSGTQLFSLLKQIAGSVYAINATVLKEVGWGTSITEDFQLTLKLYEQGYKVAYTPYIQAPSECVSTLKRLIRQRQRWAEGHSHNMKLRLHQLLSSNNMTTKEKWETVYLAPYYLQSFIFIIGTFAWIIAEVILKVKLPFWTSALGWSLVLTNLFSLPLMNTIGLFLEEGEERDYLGIFSFVTLCYILAPFIGWAALKGYIEKEEGPWFRTPKSGRITDKVERTNEKKSPRLSKYAPWIKPALDIIRKNVPAIELPATSKYLAYATAGNTFSNTPWVVRSSKIKKRVVHTFVLLLMGVTAFTNVLQTTIPQAFANPDTYYALSTSADNLSSSSTDMRQQGSTTIGSSAMTQTMDGTNTTFYMVTDNMNKVWSNDTQITDINRNLAGYWKLDECTGTSLYDSSGNANTGTWNGAGSGSYTAAGTCTGSSTDAWKNGVSGKFNSSMAFDGSNDYVSMATTANLQAGSAVTMSIWVNANSISANKSPASFFGSSSDKGYWFNINSGGLAEFWVSRDGSGQDTAGQVGSTITPGSWYHLVGTYDGATLSLYINGNLNYSIPLTGSIHTVTTANAFALGRLGAVSSDYFDGKVDDVRIYNRALSAADIHSLYQADRRNVQIATHTDGSSVAVWEDSRNTSTTYQNRFDATSGNMIVNRMNHTATPMQNGNVLITGGFSGTSTFTSSAEIYDSTTSRFTSTAGNMKGLRVDHEAVALDNSKVLIAGGRNATNTVLSSSELYDQNDGTAATMFSATSGNMIANRTNFSIAKLETGKVLAIGGCTTFASGACSARASSSELYDPATSTWTLTGALVSGIRQNHTSIRLNDGRVMTVGGYNGTNRLSTTEIYDPPAGTWQKGASLSQAKEQVGLSLLPDNRVLAVGGYDGTNYLSTTEIYDPASGTWTTSNATSSTNAGAYKDSQLVNLGNGKILAVNQDNANNGVSAAQLYDPYSETWTDTPLSAPVAREGTRPVLLPNGKVLIAGGGNGGTLTALSTAELYSPITYDIYAQKYDKTGAKQWSSGADVQVNNDDGNRLASGGPALYNHLNPTVSLDTSGNPIIAWEEQRDSVYRSTIWTQKLDGSNGAKLMPAGSSGTWAASGNFAGGVRQGGGAVVLPNGKVLYGGGNDGNVTDRTTANLFDPITGTWTATTNNMTYQSGDQPQAVVLNNGYALFAGGASSQSSALFSPQSNTWSSTGAMVTYRVDVGGMQLLNNGKALISGGTDFGNTYSTAEIYDPTTGTWAVTTGNLTTNRMAHRMVKLNNGKVLAIGGCSAYATCSTTKLTSVELFDPQANTWSVINGMVTARSELQATLLTNGNVFVVGGYTNNNNATSSAEIYSPVTGTWATATSAPNTVRGNESINPIVLPSGKVFVSRGSEGSGAYLYDPTANTWTTTGSNLITRGNSNFTYMPNGKILVTGGGASGAGSSSSELYTVDLSERKVSTEFEKPVQSKTASSVSFKKPKVAIDSSGDAIIAWTDNGAAVPQFQGSAFNFDANAFRQFGLNGQNAGLTQNGAGGGATMNIISPAVQIRGQKVCARTSGCDAGTTSGERQWGDALDTINKANPQEIALSSIRNAQNVNLVNDGTNVVLTYDSDSASVSQSTRVSKIYSQKIDTSGNSVWSDGFSAPSGGLVVNRHTNTTTLLNDGKVLIAGGQNGTILSSGEVYNPVAGASTAGTNNMPVARISHTATLLENGRVLLVGGGTSATTGSSTSTLFTPSGTSGSFAAGPNLRLGSRADQTATLLRTGQVLIAGGRTGGATTQLSASEVYNPAANTWTATTGQLRSDRRYNHRATILADGRALISGGTNGTGPLSSAEVYDPATSTWSVTGTMVTKRRMFTLSLLKDGRVLAVGGCVAGGGATCTSGANNRTSTAELYDPWKGTWTSTGALTISGRSEHTALVLPNGKVLIHGGTSDGTGELSTSEIYDPLTGTFSAGRVSTVGRKDHDMVGLPSGDLLVVDGWDDTNTYSSVERYTIDQKVSSADTTLSKNPDIVKDSDGNFQMVWQAWRAEGLSSGSGGGSWQIAGQKVNNPASGSVTKLWNTGTTDTWVASGNLSGGRRAADSVVLPSGKVLVGSGDSTVNDSGYLSTAELFDPQAGTWTATGATATSHVYGAMTVLPSGKALYAGGQIPSVVPGSTAELYEPSSGTWTATGSMQSTRSLFGYSSLASGSVLVTGGLNAGGGTLSTAEVYNPTTGTWTATTGNLRSARARSQAIRLNDGKVLSVGGCSSYASCTSTILTTTELYDPTTGTWTTTTGGLAQTRLYTSVTLLNNGRVLAAGGYDGTNYRSSAEIYDPIAQTWSLAANMPNTSVSFDRNGSILLPNGKVLVTGAIVSSGAYLYDANTNTWAATGANTKPYYYHGRLNLLKNGKILIAGGYDFATTMYSSSELYTPGLAEKLVSSPDESRLSNDMNPKIASDSASGVSYAAWESTRTIGESDSTTDKNIYMQKLDSTGNPVWPNGSGQNGSYDVRDVIVNTTRGVQATANQQGVSIGKRTFVDGSKTPIQLAWTDSREGSIPLSIYGQSYDTLNRSMTSTSWTAYFIVNGWDSTDAVQVTVGATEANGETQAFESTIGTLNAAGSPGDGEKSIVFSNLPPSGETSLNHKRLVMKITRTAGSFTLRYNGPNDASSSIDADTRLDVGIVVPERSALLGLIIPFLPLMVLGYKRRKYLKYKIERISSKP